LAIQYAWEGLFVKFPACKLGWLKAQTKKMEELFAFARESNRQSENV